MDGKIKSRPSAKRNEPSKRSEPACKNFIRTVAVITLTNPRGRSNQTRASAPDAWQEICQLHLKEWVTPGQRDKLEAEYDAGIATGKSWREIGTALGQIVKGWERGR